jgi:hypothetical protein
LQDRWVKAMRLADISDRQAANRWLPMAMARHNARFAVAPRHAEDAHGAVDQSSAALQRICSLQYVRTLSKALSCQFFGRLYQIQTAAAPRYGLRGKKITICQASDRTPILLNGQEVLPYRVFDRHAQLAESRVADDKTLNVRVDAALTRTRPSARQQPQSHPWRRGIKTQHPSRAAQSDGT